MKSLRYKKWHVGVMWFNSKCWYFGIVREHDFLTIGFGLFLIEIGKIY
jgi:hypothetical protein